ncbi:multidrug effflux MFS transporter [Tenacibaculum sp. SG-28]|uniref:multidrug effflux MFS transporter n=1 Tax=Tenacibaculum sp. SG-28 TaxID=754426 RepID=UPI000CF57496|nr:multidrug effflux MFS transporter [Tenacibaculum sp. SG-28]PQJ23256.1 Bcr/CflA family drug resistance efflux transporter [Tenacibaculum sp. SG-28]
MHTPIKNSKVEFIALMASLMSLAALSIDALLPALNQIGTSLNIKIAKDNQLLITMIFLGLGLGQLLAGPLSDSIGRKKVIYIGFSLFVIASFICISADKLSVMLLGRILQGIGLAAPRTISIAMVRDSFSGNYMAKIMSFIVVFFILVPVVAPTFGKIILDHFGWQAIFYSQLIFGAFIILWLWKRQPETLNSNYKKELSFSIFTSGYKEFIKHKQSVLFTFISGLITGSFMVYISVAQQIFEEQYNLKEEFPFIFAGLAIFIGFATFLNGTLVMKYGMFKLVYFFTFIFIGTSFVYLCLFFGKANPAIETLLAFFAMQFFAIGFLFGNIRSLAMEPIGHIAGVGSAINGFVSTVMAVPIAICIGRFVEHTTLPIFIGFLICGILAMLMLLYLKKRRLI